MEIKIDGKIISGTPEELTEFINNPKIINKIKKSNYGTDRWYYSETKKQYLLISSMSQNHLRNAINKILKDWINNLYQLSDSEYAYALRNGCQDITYKALCSEIQKRDKNNQINNLEF